MPPNAQIATLITVEASGVIIETVIKRSIPPPSEPQIASQVFCFAADADLDREQIAVPDEDSPVLDDFGDPVLDENGNPTYNNKYIDGENPAISMGTRYIFQWYSEEDFANVKVNTVGYMQEGWLADRWDYAYADPNGGYMCISFAPALAKYAALTDAQAAVHNASVRALEAAGELSAEEAAALLIAETEATDETTGETVITYAIYRRPNILKVVIPTNGIMYRYGYLDYSGTAVVEMHFGKFCHLFEDGLLYGRHADYQAYARTFNFTATGLVAKNAVYEGESFYVREESGKYVVEVKPGSNIKVSEVVDILGMLGGYGVAGKPGKEAGSNAMAVTSYKQSEATELEYTMDINGVPTMRPVQYQYEDYKQALEDLFPVLGAHVGVADASPSNWSNPTYGKFTDENIASFFEAHSEWLWFKDYYNAVFEELAAAQNYSGYTAWSPNGVRFGLEMFYSNAHRSSWPATPDFSKAWTTAFEDYCPEKAYRYDTWEDFVADFLKDFNNEVYGKEQVASAADFFNATYLADPAGETAQKMIAFFQSEKWGWLGKEIENGVAASTWTSYDNTDYRFYRCNVFEYINKTKVGSWPYSCGTFHGMADPAWVGVPLEKDYNKVIYSTEGYDLFDNIELELTVVNLSTGITDDIAVTFQVVENFTPVIRIDASKLSVALGQTSIDLTQAVKAYDVEYKERGNGVYGSDISRQFLEFVYPEGFDPQNLKPGQWTIEAVASCPANPAIKERVEFKVLVIDEKAPSGRLYNGGDLAVVKGSQLTVDQLFVYAYDNAHGDLLRNAEIDWNWYVINTDYDPATTEIGETCNGSVTLYDKSGNTTKLNFTVTVTGAEGGVVEVPGGNTGTGDITVPGGDTVAPGESCISFAYVSSFIAAAGLALLILKKRH